MCLKTSAFTIHLQNIYSNMIVIYKKCTYNKDKKKGRKVDNMKKIIGIMAIMLMCTVVLGGCGTKKETADDMSDDVIDQVSSPRIEQTKAEQTWTYELFNLSLPLEYEKF